MKKRVWKKGKNNPPPSIFHRKGDIDREVSHLLGMKQADVSAVTNEFLRLIVFHLVEMEGVKIDNFGDMKLSVRKGAGTTVRAGNFHTKEYKPLVVKVERTYRVSFKKANYFKAEITKRHGSFVTVERDMEKYGVDETGEELEKKAAQGCPLCGAKAEKHGNVLACPTHGTEPFENKKG